jgi:hypothetical protein
MACTSQYLLMHATCSLHTSASPWLEHIIYCCAQTPHLGKLFPSSFTLKMQVDQVRCNGKHLRTWCWNCWSDRRQDNSCPAEQLAAPKRTSFSITAPVKTAIFYCREYSVLNIPVRWQKLSSSVELWNYVYTIPVTPQSVFQHAALSLNTKRSTIFMVIVPQLVEKFPTWCGIRSVIIVSTRDCRWTRAWAKLVHST